MKEPQDIFIDLRHLLNSENNKHWTDPICKTVKLIAEKHGLTVNPKLTHGVIHTGIIANMAAYPSVKKELSKWLDTTPFKAEYPL